MSSTQSASFAAPGPSTSAVENVKIEVDKSVATFGGSMSGETIPTPVTVPAQKASTSKPLTVGHSDLYHCTCFYAFFFLICFFFVDFAEHSI